MAAILAFHTSIVAVDDLLDGDGRFTAMGWNPGNCANLAQAISAVGVNAVLQGPFDSTAKIKAISGLSQMVFQTAVGQFHDTHWTVQTESEYWRLVQSKSGPFFETAFSLSAILGEAPSDCINSLRKGGRLYGEMVQIHDNLNDALSIPVSVD